jgi:hypothetical protein
MFISKVLSDFIKANLSNDTVLVRWLEIDERYDKEIQTSLDSSTMAQMEIKMHHHLKNASEMHLPRRIPRKITPEFLVEIQKKYLTAFEISKNADWSYQKRYFSYFN